MIYTKGIKLYEGKAKQIFSVNEDSTLVIQNFKDTLTRFNKPEDTSVQNKKGYISNVISSFIMDILNNSGFETHFIKQLNETEQLVKKVDIIPIEVVVRNISSGTLSKKYGIQEGLRLKNPLIEFCYKNDKLGDPILSEDHIYCMDLASEKIISNMKEIALNLNFFLKGLFSACSIIFVDFKLEFGIFNDQVIIADEISPDTCRLWDKETNEKMDKDRFRLDMGDILKYYIEIANRLGLKIVII